MYWHKGVLMFQGGTIKEYSILDSSYQTALHIITVILLVNGYYPSTHLLDSQMIIKGDKDKNKKINNNNNKKLMYLRHKGKPLLL